LRGFRDLPAADRVGTDAGLDEILALVGAPVTGDSEGYELLTEGAVEVAKLATAMNKIAELYQFTAAEKESFKTSY
jgi:hypothetical protein